MKRLLLCTLLALVLTLGGWQPDQIDYDTSPLSFETVFDDTPGNPDKPEIVSTEVRYNYPPAYRVRIYEFDEDTISKGAFYILPPELEYNLEDTPPDEGIIKGVYTFDYTNEGSGTRIHHFTLSYETADGVTVHNPEIYGKGLQYTPVMGNEVALDLRLTRSDHSVSSRLWFSGDFDYNGEKYSFNIEL